MVLLIDIGNTRLKWRLADLCSVPARIDHGGALASTEAASLAAAWQAVKHVPVEAAFVSNVASSDREAAVAAAIGFVWGDVAVHRVAARARQCGVVNGYRDPVRLGPDRWLALIAAHALVSDRSQLVCSFGTATTIDLLMANDGPARTARFVGGLILPGIEGMRASLVERTARLPMATGDARDFATTTDDAIVSGIMAAQLGAIEHAIVAARRLGGSPPAAGLACILAGGHAVRVASLLGDPGIPVRVEQDLVLHGLLVVAADHDREHRSAPSCSLH